MIGAMMGVGSGKSFCTYVDEDERAAGGSTILVRNTVLHSHANLNTDLQAVAVRITLDKTITLCSVYIPPNSALGLAQLKNLADQLPTPFIIMGDFNGHNSLSALSNLYRVDLSPTVECKLSRIMGK
jgi:hypothetical protein